MTALILEKAVEITRDRNRLVYREPLKLPFATIKELLDLATSQGLKHAEWLPGISLWNSLEYARTTRLEKAKLPCSLEKYDNMCALATLLNMDDEWKAGVKSV